MPLVLLIALCGALGCLARYYGSGWVYNLLGRGFPYGTMVVNVLGAFLIGLIMEFSLRSNLVPPDLRTGVTVGFLGGLTTFSTFSYETFRLIEAGQWLIASLNVVINVLACLFFTWLGITATRWL
ncbi:MAG: fluoride efflux transporter CrcB [Deltaproteobacteria bacterium]|nr:fluoride efflux transporter CrcB [Deltaproteobacteria bacterium]